MPKRYRITKSKFYIILHDKSIRYVLNLFFSLLAPAYFKRITIHTKIRDRGSHNIMIDPHWVEKESFTNIPNLRLFSSEIVYQIGIIKIYLIYFSQSAYSFRIITKLGYQPGFFNIKTIIRHAVAAHIEGGSYTTDPTPRGVLCSSNRTPVWTRLVAWLPLCSG